MTETRKAVIYLIVLAAFALGVVTGHWGMQ